MGNKKTPLLQKLRNVGGTMYVFPSASEDIGLNLQSSTSGVAMSHFALLNIPELAIDKCLAETKHDPSTNNVNEVLSMSLQNYAMNFETFMTNNDNYNYQKLETISEKVFWHWAMHVGIIDYNNLKEAGDNIFIEKEYNSDSSAGKQDNTVIKCFGSIDAGNSLSTEFGMFNETYINVPTSWGSGPVYLQRSDDENFKLGTSYHINNAEHLEGRDDENEYYSYTRGQDYPFFDTLENEYVIDRESDGFQILKDISQIQTVSRSYFENDNIIFGSYDDINIDIDNYLNVDNQFNFNAILLYYSVYDQDDLVKTPYATNLFGIIFLDGARTADVDNGKLYIPTILKRKSTTSQFGNSYSFRVNLKTMSVYDNTDAIIQDNTTMSGVNAIEFSDAISNMNRAIDIMNSNLSTILTIQDQYASIISYYDNFASDIKDISTCLNAYIKGTRSSVVDTSVLKVNEIHSSEALDSTKNSIVFKTHKDTLDSVGNMIYNEPAMSVIDTSVIIPTLDSDNTWSKYSYVKIDKNPADANILDPSNAGQTYVESCINALNNAFRTDDQGINVKVKIEEGTVTTQTSQNELYIDSESPIFNVENNDNLRCILDENGNVNYAGMVPYLVAEIKRIYKILADNGISIQ